MQTSYLNLPKSVKLNTGSVIFRKRIDLQQNKIKTLYLNNILRKKTNKKFKVVE